MVEGGLVRMSFIVLGKVQRVSFRAFAKRQADQLGLVGWCRNTPEGTVVGVAEGPPDAIEAMRAWLTTTGSPHSRIDRLDVHALEAIDRRELDRFDVDRSYGHAPRARPRAERPMRSRAKATAETHSSWSGAFAARQR
jgi:acylphosphatase